MSSSERDHSPSAREFQELLAVSPSKAAALAGEAHAADVADWLQDVDDEDAWQVFHELETELQADVLEFAEQGLREGLVSRLSAGDLREIVEELPSDEAVDVLAQADQRVAEDVLSAIPDELEDELRVLASYPPESAGGVMTSEFVAVSPNARIGDAVKEVRKEGEEAEAELGVFVLDIDNRPVGFLSEHALLTHPIHTPVVDVMVDAFTVHAQADQEEAAGIVSKYGLSSLAVVDGGGVLAGVISAEDARDILDEEVSEDFLRMVGTAPTQQTRLPIATRVRQRMPLMLVTVLGGLLSAKLLGLFLGGDGGASAILRYLPLIIGLAGNVGIQSSTILVRGFATGEVEREREGAVLGAEVAVGTLIGVLCGGATVLVASWLESGTLLDPLGGAVGVAVAAAVSWAALLGCVVPMGCRRLGIDPAIVAGPFLICLSDISGSAIYVVVARALLGMELG